MEVSKQLHCRTEQVMCNSESQNVQKVIERDFLVIKEKVLPRIKSRSSLSYESRSFMNNVLVKVKGNIKIVFPYFCKCRSLNVDLRIEMR